MKKLAVLFMLLFIIFSGSYAQDNNNASYPVQLSLFDTIAIPSVDNIYGLEINLLYGSVNNMSGFNVGLSQNVNNRMAGLQLGVLFNSSKELLGMQISPVNYSETASQFSMQCGIANIASKNDGYQIGGINVSNGYSNSQIGIWNSSANTGIFQCGLINFSSQDLDGLQIGLLNIGPTWFTPIVNWNPNRSNPVK